MELRSPEIDPRDRVMYRSHARDSFHPDSLLRVLKKAQKDAWIGSNTKSLRKGEKGNEVPGVGPGPGDWFPAIKFPNLVRYQTEWTGRDHEFNDLQAVLPVEVHCGSQEEAKGCRSRLIHEFRRFAAYVGRSPDGLTTRAFLKIPHGPIEPRVRSITLEILALEHLPYIPIGRVQKTYELASDHSDLIAGSMDEVKAYEGSVSEEDLIERFAWVVKRHAYDCVAHGRTPSELKRGLSRIDESRKDGSVRP